MIADLDRFTKRERPSWSELDQLLTRLENAHQVALSATEIRRLHALHQRSCSALARVRSFSPDPALSAELEALVARSHAVIASAGRPDPAAQLWEMLTRGFPETLRRQWRAVALCLAVSFAGIAAGGILIAADTKNREIVFPGQFGHLHDSPSERVAQERQGGHHHLDGQKSQFAGMLMSHNIKVSLFCLFLGLTFGIGTTLLLFYNGLILGAVVMDYCLDGQGVFVCAWLLPHGSVEIPAIFIGGTGGYILARALIHRQEGYSLRARFARVMPDIGRLCLGLTALLIWAGIIEAFLSQYHDPVIPSWVKIAFGTVQFGLLIAWICFAKAPREVRR